MRSILNSPYPCMFGQKENFFTALAIGVFVATFLIVFQPFSISESEDSFRVLKTAGFGVVSFIVLLFFYFVIPSIFKKFFDEKNYTLGKDLIASIGLILMIGLANGIYAQFVLHEEALVSIGVMIWQTFLVGIFPLTFLSLIQYNQQFRINMKASKEIKIPNASEESNYLNKQPFIIPGSVKAINLDFRNIRYLESDGNYVFINSIEDHKSVKTIHRATLKSIEEKNGLPNLFRCHRSYIINLDHITEVSGNAQGLKLSIKECADHVPVSKKYIPAFKEHFYQK